MNSDAENIRNILLFALSSVLGLCVGCATYTYESAIATVHAVAVDKSLDKGERERAKEIESNLRLMQQGGDVDMRDSKGYTMLMYASDRGYRDLATFLIRQGADVRIPEPDGWTPLMCEAYGGDVDMIKLLVANGADVNARTESQDTALILAAGADNDNPKAIKVLLESGADIKATNESGESALSQATYYNYLKSMSVLIANGADVNGRIVWDKMTILMIAAAGGHAKAVRLLLANGADADAKDEFGAIAFMRSANVQTLKVLMPKTADIDARSDQGETALYWAASSGNLKTARFLIEHGADINARTKDGLTPLGVALKNNNLEIVQLLRKHGAKE